MAAAQRSVVAAVAMDVLRLFCYIFANEFLFNPHFDLEPDFIIKKGIWHRIQWYTVRMARKARKGLYSFLLYASTEILPTFTHESIISVSVCRHCKVLDENAERCQKPRQKQPLPLEACGRPSNTWIPWAHPTRQSPPQTASGSNQPFCHNTDVQTDVGKHGQSRLLSYSDNERRANNTWIGYSPDCDQSTNLTLRLKLHWSICCEFVVQQIEPMEFEAK